MNGSDGTLDGIDVRVTHAPSADAVAQVEQGLAAFNRRSADIDDSMPLGVFAHRDEVLLGGATGYSQWGWLFIEYLWVAEPVRGRGLGATLLARSEAAGRERGCVAIWLDTFSFQAPAFYERFGFRQFGQLDGYPPGGARHFLWKPLASDVAGRPRVTVPSEDAPRTA